MSYALFAQANVAREDTNGLRTYQDAYVEAFYAPDPPKSLVGQFLPVGNGQCVALLQAHGFENYKGNALEWKVYIDPKAIGWPGDAILLDEGPYQHLVIILSNTDSYNIVEQNYLGEYIISTRSISFDYNKIIGIIPKPDIIEE